MFNHSSRKLINIKAKIKTSTITYGFVNICACECRSSKYWEVSSSNDDNEAAGNGRYDFTDTQEKARPVLKCT